ncbi:MAG TPA: preprotein translocase subunit SecG [Arenimonas sp.]|nr:preprotein translocase subunit SecG [Arenimonas sp.]
MILTIVNVVYVLVAVSMIVLILMQRGAGAAAGSGFGGGASATVFGSRGSANFLSQSTKWLAVVFFAMSLGMAWYAAPGGGASSMQDSSLSGSVMEGAEVPAQPDDLPALPAQPVEDSAPADTSLPALEPEAAPAVEAEAKAEQPAATEDEDKP